MFAKLMRWMQDNEVLPKISDTERQALEAGDVWIDGEFFGGHPNFATMLESRYGKLSAEEQAFMDGPVNDLLSRADCNEIALSRRVPQDIIDYMASEGFFSLIIPKAYGGKEFSTLARSAIMAKVTPHSGILSSYVVIPNTLGAAELLVEYGTDDQKDHYLPRLAKGEYLPCFGLTEPTAGSDAASLTADAEAFRDENGDVSLRLNFCKRYITLGPVANLISLACRLRDPENLLGGEGQGFNMGQHRLAYGRLRHGMHNVAMAQRALDMATEHVTSRTTFGKGLDERQAVQFMLAECASELYIARLMLLHIAYKAERKMDMRQENGIAKVFLANMVHKVVDTAIQLHGALGYSQDTPLAAWYTHIRSQRLVDGPDEVHKWTTGRNLIKAFKATGTTAGACGGDLL